MTSFPALRRWVLSACVAAVFGAVFIVLALQNRGAAVAPTNADAPKDEPRAWPLFGGSVGRNLENLFEKNMPLTWSLKQGAEQNVKWSQALGTKAYGGPIISGGKIFVGTNNWVPRDAKVTGDKGILMCFKESTGEFLWQYVSDKLDAGRVNDWPDEGICSSPVVEGDRLWFVSNRCEVLCLSTEGLAAGNRGVQDEKYKSKTDGDVIWRLDMMGELGVKPHNLAVCSPLIVGDTLFVITSNGVDEAHKFVVAPKAPSFIAVDKNTGAIKWTNNDPGDQIMHGQWSNPVYAAPNGKPQIIFPGGDGYIRAFNPADGALLWKFDCNPKDAKYTLGEDGTKNDFVCTPVVVDNKLYIGVGQDPEHGKGVGHLWCIDITKEPKDPTTKDLSPASKPGAKPGDKPQTIFDPKDQANKDSGLVWHFGGEAPDGYEGGDFYFGRTMSTCCVHDGLVYAAMYEGYLHCLDAQTGKEYWVHDLKAKTWGSPYYVDGKIYLGDDNGAITVFAPGKEKKILATNELRSSKVEATPVAINGTLYVMTINPCKLWALTK